MIHPVADGGDRVATQTITSGRSFRGVAQACGCGGRAGMAVSPARPSGVSRWSPRTTLLCVLSCGRSRASDLAGGIAKLTSICSIALGRELVANRSALLAAGERRRARNARVFGSVARGENSESSDVDLLVSLDAGASLLDLIGFACDAEDILGVKVDVGTPETVRAHVRDAVLADAATL